MQISKTQFRVDYSKVSHCSASSDKEQVIYHMLGISFKDK